MPKLEYASSLAAALAFMMVKQQDAVGLAMFDEALTSYLPPHATRGYLRQILLALEKAGASGRTGAGKALHQVADRIKRRGLVIVLSDLLDSPDTVMTALKHFRYKKNEVIVMQVLDPLERSFALGADAVVEDLETGERLTTQPYQLERSYRGAMQQFLDRYRKECLEHHIDYVLMDTTTPFDTALVAYLNKREKMM
jgi:uncharacterized protein (DUF58 family)